MAKSISDYERERRATLKHQLTLSIPVMARAEDLSKRCNLNICYVYASKDEMAFYIAAYDDDLEGLRSKIVADFQDIYRSVISAGISYYELLLDACDAAGLLVSGANSKDEHDEVGMPMSKDWIERRRKILDARLKRHAAQLKNDDLKIQDIAAIQASLDIGLDSLIVAIVEMYSRLGGHLKNKRDKDRLKWAKIGVFVGGGSSLVKLGMGTF